MLPIDWIQPIRKKIFITHCIKNPLCTGVIASNLPRPPSPDEEEDIYCWDFVEMTLKVSIYPFTKIIRCLICFLMFVS